MACLTEEGILIDILSRLPVQSLLKFKSVSKRWHFLISDPRFAMTHLRSMEQYTNPDSCSRVLIGSKPLRSVNCEVLQADYDQLQTAVTELEYPSNVPDNRFLIVGSCNGLVCLLYHSARLTLWNPTTRESCDLPSPTPVPFNRMILHGFGYDSISDDYKLVRGFQEITAGAASSTVVEVLRLKSGIWRRIPDIDYTTKFSQGTYLNGSIHWLHRKSGAHVVIVLFNIASETFQEAVSLPRTAAPVEFEGVDVLRGCLAVYVDSKWEIELWLMKEYGNKSSWTKLFNVTRDGIPRNLGWWKPIYVTKDWKIVFDAGEMDSFSLCICDPEKSTFKDCGLSVGRG